MSGGTFEIRLAGALVGWLEAYGDERETYELSFCERWRRDPERGVLGQRFEDLDLRATTYDGGLPTWFRDLLPQGALRAFLASTLGLDPLDDLGLLVALGHDLPGAVQVEATATCAPRRPSPPRAVAAVPEGDALRLVHSLSGFQWKLAVAESERGLVVPVAGERGAFIAKLDGQRFPGLPRVEAATLGWARACGIPCADWRLERVERIRGVPEGMPTGDGSVLLSRRFDRAPLRHQEDFAQELGRADQTRGTAEELAAVVGALCGAADLEDLVARLCFCVLAGNGDAHLKNWALWYPDGPGARLSPAYDLVATRLFLPRDDLALPIGGEEVMARITPAHFHALAAAARVPRGTVVGWVEAAAARIRAAWPAASESFTPAQRTRLQAHLVACALGR